jgi:hypothetical protein
MESGDSNAARSPKEQKQLYEGARVGPLYDGYPFTISPV